MKILTPNDKGLITYTLTDGENDLFIRAKMFDKELNDVTPSGTYIQLTHLYGGTYAYKHSTNFSVGKYIIIFEVFEDANYVYLSEKYGVTEDDLIVIDEFNTIITKVDNISNTMVLRTDTRLDNLDLIPSRAKETTLLNAKNEVITNISSTVDDADGTAI